MTKILCAVGWAALAAAVPVCAETYDLSAGWSDVQNPFDVWALKKSPTALFTINQPDYYGDGSMQRAWADDVMGGPAHVPVWMKVTYAWGEAEVGDILMHGAELGRTGTDRTSAVWTSPMTGTATIAGAVWSMRVYNRVMSWDLLLDGTSISQGTIISDGTYTRASPFNLADGTGGVDALTQSVVAGDQIELRFTSVSNNGNLGELVALRFSVEVVPEPAAISVLGLGLLTAGGLMRRKLQ
jgi:hypothetical protein